MNIQNYHIITIGCAMNASDSERIAGSLERLGYVFTPDRFKADILVVTTCGVRQSAEDRVYGIVPKVKKKNPKAKIVLTGCLVSRADVRSRLKDYVDVWLPINELPSLGKRLSAKIKYRGKKEGSVGGYLKINPKYESGVSALVPIGNGCNNFCTYCVVPYARGREVYRPAEEILIEVRGLIKKGYKEITLIAQNVNSYNFQFSRLASTSERETRRSIFNFQNSNFKIDSKFEIRNSKLYQGNKQVKVIDFPILLRLVNAIPGDFWIRFATSHPKDMSDELIKTIAACKKVCRQIHLPVQAGDNEVLRQMNRKYTREHYLGLIKKIRAALPGASISTDIIVGFPGETKKQFQNSEKLFRQVKFDQAFISQYSPRPGTVAAKLHDNISQIEKKRREETLMKILRRTALDNNRLYINSTVEVLLEGQKGDYLFGKSKLGKNVRLTNEQNSKLKVGNFVMAKIISVKDFGILGVVVK